MNLQETQALQTFLNQLTQVQGITKDPQADALIANAVARQPNATYLLVQRALLMEQALNTAKTQITALENQLQATQPVPSRGFLDANAWGNTPAVSSRPTAPPMMIPAAIQAPFMQSQAPAASPSFFGGGIGSALGTVAATAAGVAGGAFLFQGIEHLMHPSSGVSGFMNPPGMASVTPPVENTTVNNFYGADPVTDRSSGAADIAIDDLNWDDNSSAV